MGWNKWPFRTKAAECFLSSVTSLFALCNSTAAAIHLKSSTAGKCSRDAEQKHQLWRVVRTQIWVCQEHGAVVGLGRGKHGYRRSPMQGEHNSHTFWPFRQSQRQCVDSVHVGAHAMGHLRGDKCGSQACCSCRCRPAVGHQTAAVWNKNTAIQRETSAPLCLFLSHTTRHPSYRPHWCQKNLLSSQWRLRPPESPRQPHPPKRSPLSMVTKEKAWKRGREGEIVQWREWGGGCK